MTTHGTNPRQSSHVILIVDDDPIVREAVARCLDEPPYTVVQAEDALQALELLRSLRVDVVIADLHMPGMNGTRFLVYVRDMFPQCVRLIMTGTRQSDIQELDDAGVDGQHVLRKGITPEDLRAKLGTLLQ